MGDVLTFRAEQPARMGQLIRDTSAACERWNRLIPTAICPSGGKLRLTPLMSLMYQHKPGGSIWIQQFLFGFKLTGALGRRSAFPATDISLGKLLGCAAALFLFG